jgi:hypothetical protein
VGAELFYADGQTDMTKAIADFPDFANAPKNKVALTNFLFAIQESLKRA